jgi:glutathione S-transferase
MQVDERLSPVPALQQLRTLHPGALQHLQQSTDGSLYPHHHHQAVPQLHSNNAVYQQYALSGPPQPPPHALHYQHHGLPGSPEQFTAYPATYQHASNPQFAIANGPVAPLPPQQQRQQQPLPLPPPPAPTKPQPLVVSSFQPQIQRHGHSDGPGQTPVPAPFPDVDESPLSKHGQFEGLKLIANPPDLEAWRQKLFDVDDYITLNEEEFVFE